jgi:hypothetical protein
LQGWRELSFDFGCMQMPVASVGIQNAVRGVLAHRGDYGFAEPIAPFEKRFIRRWPMAPIEHFLRPERMVIFPELGREGSHCTFENDHVDAGTHVRFEAPIMRACRSNEGSEHFPMQACLRPEHSHLNLAWFRRVRKGRSKGQRMPRKKNGPIGPELIARLVGILESAAARGDGAYPMTLEVLLQEAGAQASLAPALVNSVVARKTIAITAKQRTKPHTAGTWAVLRADVDTAVASSNLLLWTFAQRGKSQKTLRSLPELADQLPKIFQVPFKRHWGGSVTADALPQSVGALRVGRHWQLFLVDQVVLGRRQRESAAARDVRSSSKSETSAAISEQKAAPVREALQKQVLNIFDRLDRESGGRNYVPLLSIRRELPGFSREDVDNALNALRRDWILSLDAADGRQERLSQEALDAGLIEGSNRLVYVQRRAQ